MTDIEKALAAYLGEVCGMRLRPHALTGLAQAAIAAMQPAPQEPVAWMYECGDIRHVFTERKGSINGMPIECWTETPLYAHPPAPQWQGIESAPKDGTPFLIWSDGRIGIAFIEPCEHDGVKFNRSSAAIIGPDQYNDMRAGIAMSNHYLKTATHWMPLPTPPAGGSDAE